MGFCGLNQIKTIVAAVAAGHFAAACSVQNDDLSAAQSSELEFVSDGEKNAKADAPSVIYVDQGSNWTSTTRHNFYTIDEGAQIMPLAWMRALKQPDGQPFLSDNLSRYGFLPYSGARQPDIPVGFTLPNRDNETWIGMNCASCHTREILVDSQRYRIDGGPAIIDMQQFLVDLDQAMSKAVASDEASFDAFAETVLGGDTTAAEKEKLRKDAQRWHRRNHILTTRTIDKTVDWGIGRMDAVAMTYNRLGGLSLGEKTNDYIIEENIQPGVAPTRYPFLWNAGRQDCAEWGGFVQNGTKNLALARNLGQVYAFFSEFHPEPKPGLVINHDFLGDNNTADLRGLEYLENAIAKASEPEWEWSYPAQNELDRGRDLFLKNCAECHDVRATPKPQTIRQASKSGRRIFAPITRSARTGSIGMSSTVI